MTPAVAPIETFLGVDIGTQGVRVAAVSAHGELLADRRQAFAFADLVSATREQATGVWWKTLVPSLRAVSTDVRRNRPVAVSDTSPSGIVIPLANDHTALHPALMYGDDRSAWEAAVCRVAATCGAPWSGRPPAFAAIVAASRTGFGGLSAAAAMTRVDRVVEPDRTDDYEAGYQRFLAAVTERGFLDASGWATSV